MNNKCSLRTLMMVLVPVLIAAGCRSGSKDSTTLIDDLGMSEGTGSIQSFNQIYHLYPSPAEMLSIIDMDEMDYDEQLLNPVQQADKYIDTRSKTTMLGIYMTDLAYSALFGRHEATLDYLEVVRKIAGEIRIDGAVDEAMIRKARQNVEYLDSLYVISNDAFMNILAYCERNDRSNTVVMLSAGAFTESLFLAVNLIDNYGEAEYTLQHLADQKFTIGNFMTFAESVNKEDPNVVNTISDLKRIKALYDKINPGTGTVSIKKGDGASKDQPKKLVIGGGSSESQPSLTLDEFEELKAAVIELRTKMVEG